MSSKQMELITVTNQHGFVMNLETISDLSPIFKGHITKVYSIKGGGLKNLPGFRLIRFSCIQNKPYKLNPIGRKPDKFFSPPP